MSDPVSVSDVALVLIVIMVFFIMVDLGLISHSLRVLAGL